MRKERSAHPMRKEGRIIRRWSIVWLGALLVGGTVATLPSAGASVRGSHPRERGGTGTQAVKESGHFDVSNVNEVWTVNLPDIGGPVALSSPNVANLDGQPAVVVGDNSGYVYAYHLADGSRVAGWPFNAGTGVGTTPSVAPLGPGGTDWVFVGSGTPADPTAGGYQAIGPGGNSQWFVQEKNPTTDPFPSNGVDSSMAVGNLQGQTDVVAGSMGEEQYAMNAATGAVLPGFPWYEADSNFSTPAIADVLGNGQNQIVEGGDSTAGFSYGVTYANGGHIRVLSPSGNLFQPEPNGGLVCQYNTDEVVQSSPAVGEIAGTGIIEAVVGTGTFYSGASDLDHLLAVNATNCSLLWDVALDGATNSSPALANVLGDGRLEVVEGTNNGSGGGSVWALDAATGATIWRTPLAGEMIGSVATADLSGSGYQDVLAPTTGGVYVIDGKSGANLGPLPGTQFEGFQNAPLVTDDPNGTIGITVAGYNVSNQGVIDHFEIPGSNGSKVNEIGAWPMFHHDPQLTGTAPIPPPVVGFAPSHLGDGYWEVDSTGNVSAFGSAPSLGGLLSPPNAPIVSMVATPDGGGYWLVASDGGVFTYGDAGFFGSAASLPLVKPIVGMAATSDGKGYWLVASDGGVFTYGDAGFFGSAGGLPLVKPIVGMAATPDGKGYWLVASDGGVFTYGDAGFYGSLPGEWVPATAAAIVPTPDGNGYAVVTTNGEVHGFGDAPLLGDLSVPDPGYLGTIVGAAVRAGT